LEGIDLISLQTKKRYMISRKIHKWSTHILALANKKSIIKKIKKNNNISAVKVAEVYEYLTDNIWDQQEKLALGKINSLREDLLSSDEIMHFKMIWEPKESDQYNQEASIAVKIMAQTAAIPPKWGDFHFRLLRTFKPENCLELGTNLGISTAYLCSALDLNQKGFLVTLEGNSKFAEVAARGMKSLDLSNLEIVTGLFSDTLDGVLLKYKKFDYVFIDGHHQKDPTLAYFDMIEPFLSENAVVIFDDIYWSEGMQEAWQKVIKNDHVQAAFDFYKLGVIIYNPKISKQSDQYRLAWSF